MKKLLLTIFLTCVSLLSYAGIIASGKCGDNVTWLLSDDGALTISGSGEMNNYKDVFDFESYGLEIPWYSNRSRINRIFIEEGITSIGNHAFSYCSGLTSVTIPNSVTSIGWFAFSDCTGLTSIEIPNSVTSIGNHAFSYCSGLTSVTIPNSVTSIEKCAFSDCKGLTSITIPNSVTSIGEYAFSDCKGLTSITIPNSITSIGESSFYGCSSLTSVNIQDLASWCKIQFANNKANPLSYAHKLYLNGEEIKDLIIPNSVTSISDYAFEGGAGITSVTISCKDNDDFANYLGRNDIKSFYSGALLYKMHQISIGGEIITSIEIPNSVKCIGDYAFMGCSGLTSITIPNSVTSIGKSAFQSCSSLTSITIPNSVTNIEDAAFRDCTGLTSIEIPNSVTSIGEYAFSDCKGLTSIEIPNSVRSIESNAFFDCISLTSVNIQDIAAWCKIQFGDQCANPFYYADKLYLNGEEIKDLVIPNSVTSIGRYAFRGSGLTSIAIPKSVTSIERYAFDGCGALKSVYISDLAAWCKITFENVTSNPLDYAHKLYLNGEEIKDLIIPETVTSISDYAFEGCTGITSITIPNSVTSIGENALKDCKSISNVTISCKGNNDFVNYLERKDIRSIFHSRISGISGIMYQIKLDGEIITSIEIPNSVKCIGDYAFYGCTSLTSVTIPNSVTSIGECAFCNCTGLTSITIPNSVTSIGNSAFSGCTSLTSVTIQDLASWCKIQFGDGYANPLKYAHKLYLNGEEIKDLIIPNSVTSIGSSAFDSCTGLKSVTIPHSVYSILSSAFRGCTGLSTVTLGKSIVSIGGSAFYDCKNLNDVYCYAEKVPTINSDAFSNAPIAYATLHVPEASVNLYKNATTWKVFGTIVSLSGEEPTPEPELSQCAAPEIVYVNGKITATSSTKSATCHITWSTSSLGTGADTISPNVSISVTAYATAEGYEQSETVTATFDIETATPDVVDIQIHEDVNEDGTVDSQDVLKIYDYMKYGRSTTGETEEGKNTMPVDLGLSVKWAPYNIGATSPDEYGDGYAWGETDTKKNYNWATYKWMTDGKSEKEYVCKYQCKDNQTACIWYSNGSFNGDGKTQLEPGDDAATVLWGGNWRTPTYEEWTELSQKCTWSWTTLDGVNGYSVVGPNGNSIFLPAGGVIGGTSIVNKGVKGQYWSSTLDDEFSYDAFGMYFTADGYQTGYSGRCYGQSIRPVYK